MGKLEDFYVRHYLGHKSAVRTVLWFGMGEVSFSTIVNVTLRVHSQTIIDQMQQTNALFAKLNTPSLS